jgi:hypothetical protein
MRSLNPVLFLVLSFIYFTSCQKEISDATIGGSTGSGGTGGGGNNNNNNTSCNNTVMKLKRWQALFDDSDYIAATWNGSGGIQTIKYSVPLSEYRTATYVYQNNRITQAILYDHMYNQLYDTALFHYNSAGLVDSMYLKNDNGFDISLRYTNGDLTKLTRYSGAAVMYYWDVQTDAKGNIVKATEWWKDTGGFTKESVYTYTRDDRKNPFKDLAPFMFYLNDEYEIFWLWGPNNFTDQRYQDFSGTGLDVLAGHKYKYNENCYPASSQQTVSGQVFFPDDDFRFTYY